MQLAERSNARVVNVIVDGKACDGEIESSVDGVGNGDKVPAELEVVYLLLSNSFCFILLLCPFPPGHGALGLLSGCELDDIGDEEVTWDEEIEDGSVHNILPAIVMAPYAY